MPLLKLKQGVRHLPEGTLCRVRTSDPGSRLDVPAWCRSIGHDVVSQDTLSGDNPSDDGIRSTAFDETYVFIIRIGSAGPT
jgi:TusA-related sulfurtransferase